MKTAPKFRDALDVLCAHHVDFIIVGGVAAVLNGAPISTFDLDIVHSRAPENVERLMTALGELQAHYRDQTGRHLPPDAMLLAGEGHNLMSTRCGPLDLLGTIGRGETFESLLSESVEQSLGTSTIRVLSLPSLIRLKEQLARDKDQAMLSILRRTLAEKDRQP
jgi:hypothetical protein